ncbi:rhodanese homology domain-containing protein [Pararobbsia silviterrae]|uniref:rhodanese homology domain-containing protein n=1 Tax=Pararobbsia silviterrae TaxID=1792498 RepID=UPI001F0C0072|nr:rhodanese homology domain-containing protein [Pararobbsia silviterrae]
MTTDHAPVRTRSYASIRSALVARHEIAILDVREEDPHAKAHPLFASNLPLSRLELDVHTRLPRLTVPIVVFDYGEGLAQRAARKLVELGYTDVATLEGGLRGWEQAGGELFRDVNSASKAFGELVEAQRHTPSLPAEAVKDLIDRGENVVVLDARRFDEYATMNIPTGISVPGAELVLRVGALAPDPSTRVIVNCAGRTRSIIGAQSLVNAGIPNPVAALRNGTIGWTLAGQTLERGSARRFGPVETATRDTAAAAARTVANRAGVRRASAADLKTWFADDARTTYLLDVRTPEEFEAGHLPEAQSAPGGQLVQETEVVVPVRGARVVLVDDDGVRANMTGSWLAQMNHDVYVIDGLDARDFSETGPRAAPRPPAPPVREVLPAELSRLLDASPPGDIAVLDLTTSARYVSAHIPGAWFVLRADLEHALATIPPARCYVLTCASSTLARYAAPELAALTGKPVDVLAGGTSAWAAQGLPLESGETRLASPRIDRYRRPYEGTDNPREAMQGYLDWEYGLVAQLERDGTHGFRVI